MANPTLEDDIAFLRQVLMASNLRSVPIALDRVSAALRDRAHLEEGARLFALTIDGQNVDETDIDIWEETERARRQGTDGK